MRWPAWRTHWRWSIGAVAALALLALPCAPAPAQDTPPPAKAVLKPAPAAGQDVVTRHAVDVAGGGQLRYSATVGTLPLADDEGTVKASFVYTAYAKDGNEAGRPLTFAFNGGPGAASAYLHLGALGPHRLVLNDDGTAPPPPVQTAANPHTWLAFTDLVFVDPVGTGRSRPAEVDGKPVPESEFWSVDSDLTWMARFIRQYLSHAGRWASPVFLVGESYGGFRVARLVDLLPKRFGVRPSGAVLVSPLLDFGLTFGSDRFHIWPAVLRLPSFAAVAWHHGQAGEPPRTPDRRDAFLAEVERFALAELLPGLALGDRLAPGRRQEIESRVARYTGLEEPLIRDANGRIPREVFLKRILRAEGKVVGRYDGSVAIADPDPAAARFSDADPTMERLIPPLSAAINAYLSGALKVEDERPYVLLNRRTSAQWEWRTGASGGQSVGASSALRSAMIDTPALRVLVVHGRFDLITPYFASVHVANQLHATPRLDRNLAVRLYDAGHMMYFNAAAREALHRDAAQFYADTARPAGD